MENPTPPAKEGNPLTHVMIDLETLGTTVDTVILSIGAIRFDPETFAVAKRRFYMLLTIEPQLQLGRTISADTLRWWLRVGDKGRNAITDEGQPRHHIRDMLTHLQQYLEGVEGVWGNGASFDNAILEHASSKMDIELWPFWANRCFRTFTNQFDPERELREKSNDHHALGDCWNQLRWMRRICKERGAIVR